MDGEDLTLSLSLRTPIDPTAIFVNRSQISFPRDSCSAGERESKRSNPMDMNQIPRLGTDLDEAPSMDCTVVNQKRRSAEREEINEVGSEEEEAENTRKKLRLSKEQSAVLEECFKEHSTLNLKQKVALAKQLNLRPRQVEVWFQNRRARTKLKQTEVDCEYLKRCCENLTEENRRLHKEVLELRALKRSPHLYMQVPPTTLTMCPSCERAAAPENPTSYPFQQQIRS